MNPATFAAFEAQARAAGFDQVLERDWEPNKVIPMHTHPFAVKAIVTQGDMWLTLDGVKRHIKSGDAFEVAAEALHAEHYGEQGTSLWVARRHVVAGKH
jgi:hypothetical protein